MNTVLDDNRKLCLTSGEIIKMSETMTMMFEAEDLKEASPATVSRCGMVFTEPSRLGWRPLADSWLNTLSEQLEPHKEHILNLFDWLLPPCIYFAINLTKFPVPITKMELASNGFKVFKCLLDKVFTKEKSPQPKDATRVIENLYFEAITWSIAAITDTAGRKVFADIFRSFLAGEVAEDETYKMFLIKNPGYKGDKERTSVDEYPAEGSMFDYFYDAKPKRWAKWQTAVPRYSIEEHADYGSIIVPTTDSWRNMYFVRLLVDNKHPVLCTGETGTGKSVQVKNMMLNTMDESWIPTFLNFSARTSENQTQDIIDSKLNKRRKGVYGPAMDHTLLVFVDDLNMPMKETYGAQPPIEILRQWMDHGGWYDRKEKDFHRIIDMQFVAAMGPPGGGKTRITQRYVRHFNVINFVPFDADSLRSIFGTIMTWFLSSGYPSKIKGLNEKIVNASIDLYYKVEKGLLPTPAKSHYTFNLRDLSGVFQGITMVGSGCIEEPEQLLRLWGHECCRVIQDRLVDDSDKGIFNNFLHEICDETFGKNWDSLCGGDSSGEGCGVGGESRERERERERGRERERCRHSNSLPNPNDENRRDQRPAFWQLYGPRGRDREAAIL